MNRQDKELKKQICHEAKDEIKEAIAKFETKRLVTIFVLLAIMSALLLLMILCGKILTTISALLFVVLLCIGIIIETILTHKIHVIKNEIIAKHIKKRNNND